MAKKNLKNTSPKWDLSDFYSSIKDKKIDQDIEKISSDSAVFIKKYQNKIITISAENLFQAIEFYQEISEQIAAISTYSYLIYASDLSNSKNISFYQNISEKLSELESKLIFFTLEINQIEEKKLTKFLSDKKLKKYSPFLRDVRVFKDHQLSQELEKYSADKAITSKNAFVRLFDETVNNLKFSYLNKELSSQEIFDLLSHHDEKIRKDAAKSISTTLKNNAKIFAFITNILAKDKAIDDKWRNFSSPISARNKANFVEDEAVKSLIESVRESYQDISHRYYSLKAKMLNKKYLNYYDRNAPLTEKQEEKIPWQTAKNLVLEAYQDFSEEMAKIGKKFFDNNWIDAEVRIGKDSGAFSHPATPSVHPYILMNYQGKIRDVMTLAHELGHGIHQYLSAKQGFLMSQTPLTISETASVFGEQLVFQKILKSEKNPEKRNLIIASKVEDMINTAIRQIAFLQFEEKIHNERKKGEISLDKICDFWIEVQKESLGPIFKFSDDYRYYWSYIPHFIHSPFYVYSYAFGECLVNSLYGVYQKNSIDNFADKYCQMLKMGGTKHYQEILVPFKLDGSKKTFWKSGLNVISNYINQIEEYVK
jgi:oligoendopeptidase F